MIVGRGVRGPAEHPKRPASFGTWLAILSRLASRGVDHGHLPLAIVGSKQKDTSSWLWQAIRGGSGGASER
jgi:hypothetical protein